MCKIKNMLHLLRELLNRFLPLILLQAITFSILNAYYILLRPLLMQSLFSALESAQLNKTAEICAIYVCLLMAGVVLSYINNVILDSNLFKAIHCTIAEIFSRWHMNRNEKENQGEVFQDVTAGAASMVGIFLYFFNFVVTAGTLIYILFFSAEAIWSLPWILSGVFTVLVGINIWQYRLLHSRTDELQRKAGAAEKNFQFLFSEMQALNRYNCSDQRREEYRDCRKSAWDAKISVEKGAALGKLFTNIMIAAAFGFLFISILAEADKVLVTVANLAVAVTLLQSVAANVGELMSSLRNVTDAVVPLERVNELLKDTTEHQKADLSAAAVVIETGEKRIELREGQKAAIVGRNGSGKTTLLNRVAGIPYRKSDAEVKVFGRTAEALSFENRRQMLSVAPKEEDLFEGRVGENILMNADDAEDQRLLGLLKKMHTEYLKDYDSRALSGGQAKITNLLRACIHDSSILLADEPTASLDKQNAKDAVKLLCESAESRLLIAVTHDMEVLKEFDYILYMENMELAFVGSYEEFISSPYYEKLRVYCEASEAG